MLTRREALRRGGAGLGAALACDGSAKAMALLAERTVEPFGAAIEIAGGPRERGRRYGERFGEAIRGFLGREIYRVFEGSPATKGELLRYAGACSKAIREECPIIAEELEGMAEGTGLRPEEHVLITLHEELYHRGVLPPVPHCTAVAVGPPEAPGGPLVGQTWDWMESVAGMSTALDWRREEGPSLLAYGFPGLWVGAGMNSAGLALCWTSAELGKPNQSPRVGLPSYVLLAHLLYQPSLDDAIKAAGRSRHAGWFTFVMADESGRLVNVEGSPEGVAIEEGAGRLVRIGFGSREMAGAAGTARHPRCDAMDALLDRTKGKTDVDAMKANFADPSRGICAGKGTIDAMVFDTKARAAHLSRGPSYGVRWRRYDLS